MLTLYHKPSCSTSRAVLDLLKQNTREEIHIIEYLKDVPTQKQLKELIKMLGIKPEALVRKKEQLFKDQYEGKKITGTEWIRIFTQNPILIERPIVVRNGKAVIGRPVDKVMEVMS